MPRCRFYVLNLLLLVGVIVDFQHRVCAQPVNDVPEVSLFRSMIYIFHRSLF